MFTIRKPVIRFGTLELDDPVILTAIRAFFEVNDCVGVRFIEEPCHIPWKVWYESLQITIIFSAVEIVCNIISMWSHTLQAELIRNLLLSISKMSESLLRGNTGWLWADRILGVVM